MKLVFDGIVKETHMPNPGGTPQIQPWIKGEINIEAMDKVDLFEWHDGQLEDFESILMCFRHCRVRITIEDLGYVDEEEE